MHCVKKSEVFSLRVLMKFFIPKSGRKYAMQTLKNSLTLVLQDNYLTAGAWTACGHARKRKVYLRIVS